MMNHYKVLVEFGGGVYVGRRGDVILFRDPTDDHVFSLYCAALQSPEDVRLAIRHHREDLKDSWLPVGRKVASVG